MSGILIYEQDSAECWEHSSALFRFTDPAGSSDLVIHGFHLSLSYNPSNWTLGLPVPVLPARTVWPCQIWCWSQVMHCSRSSLSYPQNHLLREMELTEPKPMPCSSVDICCVHTLLSKHLRATRETKLLDSHRNKVVGLAASLGFSTRSAQVTTSGPDAECQGPVLPVVRDSSPGHSFGMLWYLMTPCGQLLCRDCASSISGCHF